MSGTRRGLWIASAGAAALASAACVSGAQAATPATPVATNVEEIVVVARQREENIERVPVAVTALTQERIDILQIRAVSDLQYNTPSLVNFRAGGGAGGAYAIRGLGVTPNGGSSVTAYFSEAPDLTPNSGAPLFDLASAQILRGPQGTLFGRATTGGAILFIPNHPEFNRFDASGVVDVGNLGRLDATAVVNIPLIEDQLAVRIAVNRNHVDGYTHVLGSDRTLSGVNNESARIGIEWRPGAGRFENYLVWNYHHTHQESGGAVLEGVDPTFSLFNLPVSIAAPNGALFGSILFGAVCGQAVAAGLSPSLTACEDQRLQIAATFKPTLLAELARTSAGGQALRSNTAGTSLSPLYQEFVTHQIIDVANLDLGDLGFSHVQLHNVFGYDIFHNIDSSDIDGTQAIIVEAASGGQGSSLQVGNQAIPGLGPWRKAYTEEFQIRGDNQAVGLNWILGAYYSRSPVTPNTTGCGNLNRVFAGILTPNLGYTCALAMPISGYGWERGLFGQFTVDLSRFVHGLHLTAGYRNTRNYSVSTSAPVVFSYPSGTMSPGAPVTSAPLETSGNGWNLTLDDQLTDNLLLYVATRRGYKPGGRNGLNGATGAPGYTPTFQPELVTDVEVGAKLRFNTHGLAGFINVDYYHDSYTNIQQTILNTIGGSVFTFNENVAAATLQGVEVEGEVRIADQVAISGQYSFNDNHFTEWFGGDPLSLAKPGNALCDVAHSTPTSCILDLHDNPFAFTARHQGSVTFRYNAPIDPSLGNLFGSVTVSARSRVEFTSATNRYIQAYGATQPNIHDQVSQPAYSIWNAQVSWQNIRGTHLSASAWVNNIADTVYADGAFIVLGSLGVNMKYYGPPRTYGVTLSYRFGQ
jgi:iron complex outermembrane receptor protein